MGASQRTVVSFEADDIVALHAELFVITPRRAADRLRSRVVLEGAAARPRQHAPYAGADLAAQAAVLVHGIAEGQPFVDGNKQTSLLTLLAFLDANGQTLATTDAILADQIPRLSRDVSGEEFAAWIRRSLVARGES